MFMLFVFVFGVFLFGMFFAFVFAMRVLNVFVLAVRIGMFGALLSDVSGEFRAVDGAARFDFRSFFFGKSRNRLGMNFLVFVRFFFGFVLFENGAACKSVSVRFRGGLFVLGFREIGS
jgi:hypothetical protein